MSGHDNGVSFRLLCPSVSSYECQYVCMRDRLYITERQSLLVVCLLTAYIAKDAVRPGVFGATFVVVELADTLELAEADRTLVDCPIVVMVLVCHVAHLQQHRCSDGPCAPCNTYIYIIQVYRCSRPAVL